MGQLEKVGLRRESLGFAIGSALFALAALPGYATRARMGQQLAQPPSGAVNRPD